MDPIDALDPLNDGQSLDLQDDSFAHNQDIIVAESAGFQRFHTIDCIADSKLASRSRLPPILSHLRSWACLTIVGILVGLVAALLAIITEYLGNIKSGYCSTNFYLNRSFCCWGEDEETCSLWVPWTSLGVLNYTIFVVLSVSLALIAGLIVQRYAPLAAGSGISEIKCIVLGFTVQDFLGWPTFFIKALCLPLAIASGLSIGKEGPSVHYAVAAGYSVAKLFPSYATFGRIREILVASSAAGVAVAFGLPIGGVLFSIEEIASNFRLSTIWKSYFCLLVAVSTLSLVNPFRTGQLVVFEVEYDESWHLFEVPIFIVLGIFGGIYGIVVSHYNISVVSFRKRYLSQWAIKELIILSLFSALICYFNEFLRLDMTEAMQILFHECGVGFEHRLCNIEGHKLKLFLSLMLATVLRMGFTVISYGCKVPCGIFVPSMAAGATFGRAVGILIENFRDSSPDNWMFSACPSDKKCITPGTYAFLGAAAALSGITDLTVTVVVIMFELTGALRYILPTMIVVGVTKIINDKWGHGAIADQMIRFNGLPFIDPKEDHIFNLGVERAMTEETLMIPMEGIPTVASLKLMLNDEKQFQDLPVVQSAEKPYLVGTIHRNDLLNVLSSVDSIDDTICDFETEEDSQRDGSVLYFNQFLNKSPITVTVGTSLEETMEIFFKVGPRTIFVEEKGLLKGLLTKKDIVKFERYLEKLEENGFDIEKIRRQELRDPTNNEMGYKVYQLLKKGDEAIMKLLKR